MARGVPTPESTELEFRKHYLTNGCVSASARAVNIPVSTGFSLADKANNDPEFVRARDSLRARVLPDAELMVRAAMDLAFERMLSGGNPPTAQEIADIAANSGLKSLSWQDARPAYQKNINDALKTLVGARRLEAERSGELQSGPAIVIKLTDTAKDDPNGSPDGKS